MKRLMTIAFATIISLAFCADNATRPARRRPDANHKPSGGMVEKEYKGKVLLVVDAQNDVAHEKIANWVLHMRWESLLPFDTTKSDFNGDFMSAIEEAKNTVSAQNVGAGVLIVKDPSQPFRIYTEESNWAILNTAFLFADNPDTEKLDTRMEKMLWRVIARSLHVGASNHGPTALQPFSTLAQLDANTAMKPGPDGFNGLIDNGKAYGIRTITISSYRTACRNGWAPYPTNDVQKAIWDEVRQLPTKPLTIEFDPAKGK